jgi:hypothetical protein
LNLYVYLGNDPINGTDLLGLKDDQSACTSNDDGTSTCTGGNIPDGQFQIIDSNSGTAIAEGATGGPFYSPNTPSAGTPDAPVDASAVPSGNASDAVDSGNVDAGAPAPASGPLPLSGDLFNLSAAGDYYLNPISSDFLNQVPQMYAGNAAESEPNGPTEVEDPHNPDEEEEITGPERRDVWLPWYDATLEAE